MNEKKELCCCVFGHRKIDETDELKNNLRKVIEDLITKENVGVFLFGSKSQFDKLCLKIVTGLKEKYSHIRRIYVRAEYPYVGDSYEEYLLKRYDDTYFPEKILNAGRCSYVERNYEMIDNSDFCVVYYDENYAPPKRKISKKHLNEYQPKSGTKLAFDYAAKKKLRIINVFLNRN